MIRFCCIFILFLASVFGGAAHAQAVPTFSAVFSPDTIGPGATSRLIFTITNPTATVVNTLAFSNTLPASVTIAPVPNATTTCTNATVTAPAGGGTITFGGDGSAGGAAVGGNTSCTVAVDVTSGTAAAYENTSGDLTSSAGNSGSATAFLTVASDRPGFAKAFSPSTVAFGATVPLTFTIDNTANAGGAFSITFTDTLPTGLTVVGPGGGTTSCANTAISAAAGGSSISVSPTFGNLDPAVAAGASCTITVNVAAGAAGALTNVTGTMTTAATFNGAARDSGTATAQLTVTAPSSAGVALTKQFLSSVVAPGSTIDVKFTLQNSDASFGATAIGFSDDLNAMLAGAVATALPADGFCGAGSTISGTSVLTMSGGELAPRASCAFTVSVQVPGTAADGTVTNTTSATSATIDGSTVAGDPATAQFSVDSDVPVLTKTFTNDPVAAGGTVTLEFGITNSSGAAALSDLAFIDQINNVLTVGAVTLPGGGFCGGGSTITFN